MCVFRGIDFEAESAMRLRGLSKTPDVLLTIPAAVRDTEGTWHVVTWIDSKAMFGSGETFEAQVRCSVRQSRDHWENLPWLRSC